MKVVAVWASVFFLSYSAIAIETVEIDGRTYVRERDGKLVLVQKALDPNAPLIPKALPWVPKALPVGPEEDEASETKTKSPIPTGEIKQQQPPLVENNEKKATEIILDEATAKTIPYEQLDLSEIEKDDINSGLGLAGAIVGLGVYAARRLTYLRQHPGIRANNALELEIRSIDGFMKRVAAFEAKLGLGTRIVGNKIVVFLKNGKSDRAQISRLKSEIVGLALEWKKHALSFDRLETKLDVEHLRRRQQVYLSLDQRYTELKGRRDRARKSTADGYVETATTEELTSSEKNLDSASRKLDEKIAAQKELERHYRALSRRANGSAEISPTDTHPLALASQANFRALRDEINHHRALKYKEHTTGIPEEAATKASEEKIKELREKALATLEQSYQEQNLSRQAEVQIADEARFEAKKRNERARARYQDEVKQFSELKAQSLAQQDREIESTADMIRLFQNIETARGNYMVDNLPDRVNAGLAYFDGPEGPQINQHFKDLDQARSRLELAMHSVAEDNLTKESKALADMSTHMLTLSSHELERAYAKLYKLEGASHWIEQLRLEAIHRIGKNYREFQSVALSSQENFLKLLAGDNQSLKAEDAEIARALIHDTANDLDAELYQGQKSQNLWYGQKLPVEERLELLQITKKLRPIADRGSEIDETRRLSVTRQEMANEHRNLRFVAAPDVAGRVEGPEKNREMAAAAARSAIRRPAHLGSAIMGCAIRLRHQLAAF